MRPALLLILGEPVCLAVGFAARACVVAFGPHDFAGGLGVSASMAGLTLILAVLGGAVATAAGIAPSRNKETR